MADRVEKAKALFFEALGSIEKSDYATAERKLREALRFAPKSASILTNLAVVLLRQGEDADATTYAEQALAANPSNLEALLVLADGYAKQERDTEASIARIASNRSCVIVPAPLRMRWSSRATRAQRYVLPWSVLYRLGGGAGSNRPRARRDVLSPLRGNYKRQPVQHAYGVVLSEGIGLLRDPVMAFAMYSLASRDPEAVKTRALGDELQKRLSPDELARARALMQHFSRM